MFRERFLEVFDPRGVVREADVGGADAAEGSARAKRVQRRSEAGEGKSQSEEGRRAEREEKRRGDALGNQLEVRPQVPALLDGLLARLDRFLVLALFEVDGCA